MSITSYAFVFAQAVSVTSRSLHPSLSFVHNELLFSVVPATSLLRDLGFSYWDMRANWAHSLFSILPCSANSCSIRDAGDPDSMFLVSDFYEVLTQYHSLKENPDLLDMFTDCRRRYKEEVLSVGHSVIPEVYALSDVPVTDSTLPR